MTIRFPKRTIADEVLDLVGKKRAYRIPGDPYKHGPYSYVMAGKGTLSEGTGEIEIKTTAGWMVLFRRFSISNEKLGTGMKHEVAQ